MSKAHIHRYVHGSRFCEDVCVDVHHQVSTRCVFHNKTHMLRCLEAGKQVDQEGMMGHIHGLKDALLAHQTRGGGGKRCRGATVVPDTRRRLRMGSREG